MRPVPINRIHLSVQPSASTKNDKVDSGRRSSERHVSLGRREMAFPPHITVYRYTPHPHSGNHAVLSVVRSRIFNLCLEEGFSDDAPPTERLSCQLAFACAHTSKPICLK